MCIRDRNNSTLSKRLVRGQFTAPQNIAISPISAANTGSSPKKGAMAHPKVEPINNVGIISPPLKPQPIVAAVSISFKINAKGDASPERALYITGIPAQLYSVL